MKHAVTRSFSPRALSGQERSITRWLIEHASSSEADKKKYLAELEQATVVGICGCGCASVDFAISGVRAEPSAPLDPFGDYITKDRRFGVFVFSKHRMLAGIEIYSLQGDETGSEFPLPEQLEPMQEETQTRPTSRPV